MKLQVPSPDLGSPNFATVEDWVNPGRFPGEGAEPPLVIRSDLSHVCTICRDYGVGKAMYLNLVFCSQLSYLL